MKGRSYSEEFKEQILQEVKEVGNVSLVGRKHGISTSLTYGQFIRIFLNKFHNNYFLNYCGIYFVDCFLFIQFKYK